jgi:hypothetical protein
MKRRNTNPKHRDIIADEIHQRRPDVILDFVFENGTLFITIHNIGDEPALKVKTTFDKRFSGLNGTQQTSSLPLFRNIEFLAPHKEIRTLLDTSTSYFQRRQPMKIQGTISYRDRMNKRYVETIAHDLSIYKDIAYVHSTTNERGEE